MENTKPDVLQGGPLDQQREAINNADDANNSLSSESEASAVEESRNEELQFQRDKVTTDPPVFSPLKNFSSRSPSDSVIHSSIGKPLLLRPSVLSGSSAEVGCAALKPDGGSFSSIFGARPSTFSMAARDPVSTAGSARPFLLRPSKLTAPASDQNDGMSSSVVTSSIFGAKPSISSDLSKEPVAGSGPCKPIFLRPSKLAVASSEKGSDATTGNSSVGQETNTAVSSESGSEVRDENNTTKLAVLRPSQLAATTADLQISEKTAPPKNPFARVPALSEERDEKEEKGSGESGDMRCPSETQVSNSASLPKFVRLTSGSSVSPVVSVPPVVNPAVTAATAPPTFVFGQNLLDRVETKENKAATQQHLESNGANSSEMLFTSVIRKEDSNDGSNSESAERPPSKSLSDAAREYEESRAAKRKYEEVAVVTGEEDEANVVQMNCKLYAFEKSKGTWVERGRGTLRLNDRESALGAQSRVVVRTAGNLRVVINTKVWAGMVVERASPKSVRLTAMDTAGEVKVFLVAGSQKETEQLYKSLVARVERQRAANAHAVPPSHADADADAPPANPEPKRVAQDAGGMEDDADTGEAATTL